MIEVIGIGGCGNNILEFFKKQNLQDKKSNYEFISLKDDNDIKNLNLSNDNTIFTISGLGGNVGGNLTISLSKKILNNSHRVKHIIILPFSMEHTTKKAIKELEELMSINQNIVLFANDDISNENNQDKTINELMRDYDSTIFTTIIEDNQRELRSFIIDIKNEDTRYKAMVNFWSKSYKITLLEPACKMIHQSSIGNVANHRFDFEDNKDEHIVDIKKMANNALKHYIEKGKS